MRPPTARSLRRGHPVKRELQTLGAVKTGVQNAHAAVESSATTYVRARRKSHFSAPSSVRRQTMSSTLSKELRQKYNARSIPIRNDDEVRIVRGKLKGLRARPPSMSALLTRTRRDKSNGATASIGIHACNVGTTSLKLELHPDTGISKSTTILNSFVNDILAHVETASERASYRKKYLLGRDPDVRPPHHCYFSSIYIGVSILVSYVFPIVLVVQLAS
ncbi:hypothetical protein EXIGLDRAFT_692401 [Exidia glandulosa HHB12029]|uniref:Uncharacterized protein n=1 Tax=Exidia glandulosa HHB12029 TaxID=1314781 RepID=A0A165I1D8_EXIGL|nr:hypothetical protein EXIGLDRAFT_692401 [Exidia glandulosa HHB12029]